MEAHRQATRAIEGVVRDQLFGQSDLGIFQMFSHANWQTLDWARDTWAYAMCNSPKIWQVKVGKMMTTLFIFWDIQQGTTPLSPAQNISRNKYATPTLFVRLCRRVEHWDHLTPAQEFSAMGGSSVKQSDPSLIRSDQCRYVALKWQLVLQKISEISLESLNFDPRLWCHWKRNRLESVVCASNHHEKTANCSTNHLSFRNGTCYVFESCWKRWTTAVGPIIIHLIIPSELFEP